MAADSLRTWPLAEWLGGGSALEPIEWFQAGSGQPARAALATKSIDWERRTCVASGGRRYAGHMGISGAVLPCGRDERPRH